MLKVVSAQIPGAQPSLNREQVIESQIQTLIDYVKNTPDDDRAEADIFGFHVRVRRVVKNTKASLVLEVKQPWETNYHPITFDQLSRWIYQTHPFE